MTIGSSGSCAVYPVAGLDRAKRGSETSQSYSSTPMARFPLAIWSRDSRGCLHALFCGEEPDPMRGGSTRWTSPTPSIDEQISLELRFQLVPRSNDRHCKILVQRSTERLNKHSGWTIGGNVAQTGRHVRCAGHVRQQLLVSQFAQPRGGIGEQYAIPGDPRHFHMPTSARAVAAADASTDTRRWNGLTSVSLGVASE
jgi:hypothetical protein